MMFHRLTGTPPAVYRAVATLRKPDDGAHHEAVEQTRVELENEEYRVQGQKAPNGFTIATARPQDPSERPIESPVASGSVVAA